MSEGTTRPLRAAVIGLGSMGRNHVRVWDEAVDGVELVAIADPDPEALRRASDGRRVRAYADAGAMLAEESLDLVSVAVPTSMHLPATLAALGSGAHVLVEKPIAASREEAEAMMAAATDAGRILSVGHIERFNPAIRELRRRLAAGELGRIFEIRATRLGPFPARIRDVGVVLDLAPHDLDVMRYLIGSDPVRVYGETERRIHTDHEDLFAGLLRFANGAVGVLDINWLTPTKQRTLTVTGERGMFTADYLAQDLISHNWSVKHLHRQILLSATYQQTSVAPAVPDAPPNSGLSTQHSGLAVDPEDRLLWHYRTPAGDEFTAALAELGEEP